MESGFCGAGQALGIEKSIEKSIRPIEEERGEEGNWDGAEEEGRSIKGQKNVEAPSQAEYEAHMRTHIPYKRWCPFCVKGKRSAEPHRAEKEKEEKRGSTIGIDYMWQKGEINREKKAGKIVNEAGSMPTVVMAFSGEESDQWVA